MTMPNMRDPDYLAAEQYRNSSRLDARAEMWRRYSNETPDRWFRWVFDQLEIPEKATVLEVGAGPGWLWEANADRVPRGWAVTVTDLSDGMVAEAGEKLSGMGPDFRFRQASADALPFDDESFDGVIANHMLYHVPDIGAALAEMARVIRPGGRLHASTNSRRHIQEIRELQRMFAADPSTADGLERRHGPFRIENGAELIEPHFSLVKVIRDESVIRVDDPAYVVGFLTSSDYEIDVEAARSHIASVIEAEGAFPVTRSTGLFVATK